MEKQIIPFKFHPRVFNSLGADLVTDDIVAIIELVKNAYDAGADKVIISFIKDSQGEGKKKKETDQNQSDNEKIILEIFDNGQGMTKRVIENAWFTVATPHKEQNKSVKIDKDIKRTVSGEKGLGRLSTARLGSSLEMYTKSGKESCWLVKIDWDQIIEADNISDTGGTIEEAEFPYKDCKSGTIIRINNLYKDWSDDEVLQASIDDLKNNLSRFISPFHDVKQYGKFGIFIKTPLSASEIKISSPKYLNYPMYSISGDVDNNGSIKFEYKYNNSPNKRNKKGIINDNEVKETDQEFIFCGSFQFEFRVWDYDAESIDIFTNRFDIKKSDLQKSVSYHKGISVYRDGILVLPKTDISRDWLGLDLRRISRIGARISNRQIIGYVSITANNNPKIIDASNREGFKNNKEVRVFKKYLLKIVQKLENFRDKDKADKNYQEPPFSDILSKIFPGNLKDKVEQIIKNNGTHNDILNAIRGYEDDVEQAQNDLKNRVYYYSRMATIGTLSAFLVHEINGRTGDIGYLHTEIRKKEKSNIIKWISLKKPLINAENAVNSLESLANRFSPLTIKKINRAKSSCDPIHELREVISSFEKDLEKYKIMVKTNTVSAVLDIFAGEMSSIYYNLFSNAIYWLNRTVKADKVDKVIEVNFRLQNDKKRLAISFHDSGPGVENGMEEKIFWPGVTNRTDGFGMGLTVVSEIVSQHGGKMSLIKPGKLGGATFRFDLPIRGKQ
jgi:signal transduction histidine kinase